MKKFLSYIVNIVTIIITIPYLNAQQPTYNLYYTDIIVTDLSHHCLYFIDEQSSNIDGRIATVEQTIEYCFRPLSKKTDIINEAAILSVLTFDQLKIENITSEILIEWSIPIDVIERYENFLEMNKSSSDDKLYRCIEPWFGPFCQYSFDFNQTFTNIVDVQLYLKSSINTNSRFTCYIHMECKRYSDFDCLDWREICDNKIDCINGEDEENCFQLEVNECHKDEYQCRNGMCIDKTFLLDGAFDIRIPECLDGSDGPEIITDYVCEGMSTFRCEEVAYQNPRRLACGDGTFFYSILPRHEYFCMNKRDAVFHYFLKWNTNNDTRFPYCFKLLRCAIRALDPSLFAHYCKYYCQNRQKCKEQILQSCPSAFIAPTFPVWDNHVRLGYFSSEINAFNDIYMSPHFVCYDQTRCPFLIPTIIVENYTCIHIRLLNLSNINDLTSLFVSCNRVYHYGNETHCLKPNMLKCSATNKCVSHRRIMDGIVDCFDGSDESQTLNSCALKDQYRFQCTSENKCLSPMLVDDSINHCLDGEDEHHVIDVIANIHLLPFSALCNNWIDMVTSKNETDEMYCDEQWPCLNQYTRCNGVWNCPQGRDEINCSSKFQCPPDHHPCLFPNKLTMDCLHINYTNDGIVHCFGATDERSYCKSRNYNKTNSARCWNETSCRLPSSFCYLCEEFDNIAQLCEESTEEVTNIIEYVESAFETSIITKIPFSHKSSKSFPSIDKYDQNVTIEIPETTIYESMNDADIWLCNRGILIRVGTDRTEGCLCPPNYYSNHCKFQSDRVSLTLRLRKENFQRLDIIGLVIRLVDHTGVIHSFNQFTYIPSIDCDTKFNFYLLYQTRPKDMTKNYTINIDAYDKFNLTYLTSWTLSIPFLFMPVNRVSAQLIIPSQQNCHLLCNHKYVEALRNVDLDSCQCNRNLSTMISKIRNECNCSPDSICVGFANNRSICLCPLNKIGPRCYIKSICQTKKCQNQGVCVPYRTQTSFTYFICVCPEGYNGVRCENRDVSIHISFSDTKITDSLLLHYITVNDDYLADKTIKLSRATMFKKIPYHLNTINVYMPFPFHLLFVQLIDRYYLIVLQHNYTSSARFSTEISPSKYCPHIRELFDKQTVNYSILRRVTKYHILCQNYSNINCFHDGEIFMCLCTDERHANCFHFDFNMTYNCQGQNLCENEGKCYQDHQYCPTMTMCVCPECFFGAKCQFYAKSLGLTLDSILGYHIYPNLSISDQSISVKISIGVTTFMLVFILIIGTLLICTFQTKVCQGTGCGMYLYISSIVSILTIVILNLKLWIFILSQMNVVISKGFLLFNCIIMDFLLRFSLALIDWLHASVAIERLLVAFLGVKFNKIKSKQAAKRVIIIIIIFIALSLIHDPIHRRLFDDSEEQRIWCLDRYTSSVIIYNTVMNIMHFIGPFSVNLLSAIGIIVLTTKQRVPGKTQEDFFNRFKKQFNRHKHLLLSSILLVILALPRLIISFLPNCMTSPREYKLYLTGYFISFIPPLLIFFVFILTSTTYRKECYSQTIQRWRTLKRFFSFSN